MRRFASVSPWVVGFLVALIFCATPRQAAGQSTAEWEQMKAACRNSGGQPSSEYYNDWVRLGGCICPPSSVGSGQPTCNGSASSSSSSSGPFSPSMAPIAFGLGGLVLGSLGGPGGLESGTSLGMGLGLLLGASRMSTPLVVGYAVVAGGLAGDGYYRYKYAQDTAGKPAVAQKPRDQVVDVGIGLGTGAVGGFLLSKVAGSAEFQTLPSFVRALGHLRLDATTRRLSVAW